MKKELTAVKNRIKKLKDKKALIDEELEPLFIREEELENEEIIAICRKNNITISDLMAKVNREKAEVKKEKTNAYALRPYPRRTEKTGTGRRFSEKRRKETGG